MDKVFDLADQSNESLFFDIFEKVYKYIYYSYNLPRKFNMEINSFADKNIQYLLSFYKTVVHIKSFISKLYPRNGIILSASKLSKNKKAFSQFGL